jgi:hypothetical protein
MAKKIILYVHEAKRQNGRAITHVTRLRKDWRNPRSKKQRLDSEIMTDEPGTWFEGSDEWNCHADGCDYLCHSLEEAISRGVRIFDTADPLTGEYPEYEFRYVVTPYDFFHDDPELYHLELAAPMTIDYPKWKAAIDEENRQIELRWQQEHQQAVTL